MFTIIRDELVGYIISATEKIAGDLDKPGNGILIVLPTDSVYGLIEYGKQIPWPE
jgi:tRNA A37 threonylcarbamoyladenosine synthetase subunit TsaC/SUA5/YrdC